MYSQLKKLICIFMVATISLISFSGSAFSLDAEEVLEFKISDDGFAAVSDCDEAATGSVTIPAEVKIDGVSYKVKHIGNKAFDGCYYITDIIIPEGVTVIGNHAFRDCISLENLYVPESLIVCQYDAFDGCASVTVHCYKSNYQFFGVFGMSANISVNILNPDDEAEAPEDSTVSSDNFVSNFVEALKRMINSIIEYFNADDDFDFEFDLPFDLPFEIPV